MNYELAALSPHLEENASIQRRIEAEMCGVLERGVADGVIETAHPRMIALALALLSLGIDVARWYRDEGEWTPEQIANHYCELALRRLRHTIRATTTPVA